MTSPAPERSTGTSDIPSRRRPPGPRLDQFAVLGLRHADNFYTLLPEISRRYGDIADLSIPFVGTTTLLAHPHHVEHVMIRNHDRYIRHRFTGDLVVGETGVIPLLVGDSLKQWRQPLNPLFTEKSMAVLSRSMADAIAAGMDAWSDLPGSGTWVDLEHQLGVVVLDAVMRSMLSTELDAATMHRYVIAARDLGSYTIGRAFMSPLPKLVPRPFQRRGEAAQRYLLGQVDTILNRRLSDGPGDQPDVLDVLMSMTFEGSPEQQYRRLRTEVSSMVFAAFETTAQTVAWTIALLHGNPSALQAAYAEVDALDCARIDSAELSKLPYLRACFDETMRIGAPPAFLRKATEEDVIDGYLIPKDSHILISPYGLHRDPRFWNDPHSYEPNRFLTDDINRNAYIPFNTGPRKCMGWRMAYIDGVMTLAAVLQRFSFQIRPGWTPKPKLRLSAGLVGGLPVRLTAR